MSDFPILDDGTIYLDSASTSQKPIQVIQAVEDFYSRRNANVHRGIYRLSEESTRLYEEAHDKVADFIGALGREEIIFTKNTTESLNNLARMLEDKVEKDDEILISRMEHHSNLIPWQQLAKRKKAVLKFIEIDENGDLIWEPGLVTEKTKVISVVHVSNVLGTINPVEQIGKDKKDSLFIVDAAQSVPHMKVDVKKINCDFLVFSGHKMLGPTGIGVLYGRKDLLKELEPVTFGGDMISSVSYDNAKWNDLPWKFEAGTPNVAGAVGLSAAIDYLLEYGMDSVENHERKLADYAVEKLREVGAEVYGPRRRIGVVSFNIPGIHPHDLASVLAEDNICIRSGHHCAMPLMDLMEIGSTARTSFYIYNKTDDVDKAIESIKGAKEIFGV